MQTMTTDFPMGVSPHELQSWLVAFDNDPTWAFYACPNFVYSDLRRFGLIDPEHDLTDKGRNFLKQFVVWQNAVKHCPPGLQLGEHRC